MKRTTWVLLSAIICFFSAKTSFSLSNSINVYGQEPASKLSANTKSKAYSSVQSSQTSRVPRSGAAEGLLDRLKINKNNRLLHLDFTRGKIPVQIGFFYTPQNIRAIQDIGIADAIGDRFTVTDQNKLSVLLGLGYFVDGAEIKSLHTSYGVNAYYLVSNSVKGDVYQEFLYNNLSYQYQQTNIPIYASIKTALKTKYNNISLVLDGGIGPNITQTSNFRETTQIGVETIPDAIFAGKTKVNFSATAALSLRSDKLTELPVECGYRFFYLGKASLKKKTDQVLNTLDSGINYAHAMVCSITF